MNCRLVKRQLQSFLDRTLDKDKSMAMEMHLSKCTSCSIELESLKTLISHLKNFTCPEPADAQWKSMHDSILKVLPTDNNIKFRVISPKHVPVFFTPPLRAIAAMMVLSLVTLSAFFFAKSPDIASLIPFKHVNYPSIVVLKGSVPSVNASDIESNSVMAPGRAIQTGNTLVQIQIDDKSSLRLGKNTLCSLKDYASNKAIFTLAKGDLNAQVSKRKPDQLFRIETPNAFCEVIGTRFDITTQRDSYRDNFITTLVVHEGTVKFGSSEKVLFVKAGNAVAIFGDSMGTTVACEDSLIRQLREQPGKGLFTIASVPTGSDVFIDNVLFGKAPVSGSINYGFHSIRLSRSGCKEWGGIIEITASASIDTMITLQQVPGRHHFANNKTTVITTGELKENILLQNALQLTNNGFYNEAIVEFLQFINEPSTPDALKAAALQKLSVCYRNIGDAENAIKTLTSIQTSNFSSDHKGTALFERATIYKTMLNNPQKAIADYEQYLSLYSDGIWAEEVTLSLAELFKHSNSFKKAADTYQRFCNKYKDSPQYEKALFTLGTIYYNDLSDYNRAMSTYSRLIQEFPASGYSDDASFWGADCLLKLGHANRALSEFNNYLNRYPKGKWVAEATTRLHRIETTEAH